MSKKRLRHPQDYGLGRPVVEVDRFDATYMRHPSMETWLPVYRQPDEKEYMVLALGTPKEA